MAAKTKNKEKIYKSHVKVFAVILPIVALIAVMAACGNIADFNFTMKYAHLYNCVLTGAEAEKQEDGSYVITVSIKNDSAYQSEIARSSIWIEYGSGTSLENRMPAYAEADFLRSLNRPIIPAGQTIEYQIQILPPEGIDTVKLCYGGISYNRYSVTGEEYESSLTVKLS